MEHVAVIKYGIEDIRLFPENDVRFLEAVCKNEDQFKKWLQDYVDVMTEFFQEAGRPHEDFDSRRT